MNSAVDFLLTLGAYYSARVGEAFNRMISGIKPWDAKVFFSGVAGLIYLIGGVVFLAYLLYDGFKVHSRLNFLSVLGLAGFFVLSLLR